MELPKPFALSVQELNDSANNTISENDLTSGMLYKTANADDLSSLTPQSRSRIKKAYPQCMSKAQQKAIEDNFASPRAPRSRVEKPFSPSIVSFLPGSVTKYDQSPEIIQRAIHMVSVYPVMRVTSTAFANALQMTQRSHRRSTFDRLEQSSSRLSRKSISIHDKSDNPVTMDSPGAMAATAIATNNNNINNNNNNNYNVSNLSMTNTNLSDMSAHLNDSFNCDMSMMLEMSWTRLELMEDRTDNVNSNVNSTEAIDSSNTKRVEASSEAENVNNAQNTQIINHDKGNDNKNNEINSSETRQSQQYHHHHHYQSPHFALRQSVVQIAATLKRAMMWSVIIVNMLAHKRMVSEFCALRLRRVLEEYMLPVLLARKEETGSIVPAQLKAARDDRAAFTHGDQRRDAQESLHGHYLKEHSSFLASFNCTVLLETLAENMERLRYVADEVIVRAYSLDQQEMYFLVSGKVEINEPITNEEQIMKQKGFQQHEYELQEQHGCNALTPMHGKSRFITSGNQINSANNSNAIRRPKKTVLLSGSTFGGVFRTNTTYSATYKALTQCIVWKLSASTFERAFKMYADETMLNTYVDAFRALNMEYLTTQLSVSAAMPRIPIYRLLDRAVANYAADFTPLVKVRGEVLFKENDPPGVVYCLIEGAVLRQTAGYDDDDNSNDNSNKEVLSTLQNNATTTYSNNTYRVDDSKNTSKEVNYNNSKEHNNITSTINLPTSSHGVSQILTTNNIQASAGKARFVLLGDEAHVLPCLQRYSCTVHSRVALFYCIRGEQFVNALLDHPTLYVALREQLTEQLRSRMKLHPSCLTYCPLFRHLPNSALHALCAAAEPRIVQRGCAICEPVQHVKEIFLVVRGQVRDARLAQRTPDPPLPCVNELESFEQTNATDERHRTNGKNVSESNWSKHRHAERNYQTPSSPRSQHTHANNNNTNNNNKAMTNNSINNTTNTRVKGKSNVNMSVTDSRHKNDTLPVPSRTNIAASMKSNYTINNNNNSISVNGLNATSPPWQHALLDADHADSNYIIGSPFSLSASALINKAFHATQANNSPNTSRMNNMNSTLKPANTFTSSRQVTQSTKGVASTWNNDTNIKNKNNSYNKKLTAGNGTLTATYNTMQRYSNTTGAVEVVIPLDEEELNPPLPRTSTRRFTYTIGGYWIGLLVEKWPYGFESTTTVELFAIPTLKIRNEFNACAKMIQNAILHDVREAQRVEMGWMAIKVNKLPPMEAYQPLHTRSANPAANVQSRNTGNNQNTTRSNKSTLKYKSTNEEEGRPGSSRRLSRSPSVLQRSAINKNNNNMRDTLNESEIGTQIMKKDRCLSRSDELQSTINEYDACFTHLTDESSRGQTQTRGKAYQQQQEEEEEEEEEEWNSTNYYNNNSKNCNSRNNRRWSRINSIKNRNWTTERAADNWLHENDHNHGRTKAMHHTMQTTSSTNGNNKKYNADKQRRVHLTGTAAQLGKEGNAGTRVTRSVESIMAEYKIKSADREEYNVNRNKNNNNTNSMLNARTKQALARYNGEPQTASEHIINSVIRDPVTLPSVHVHRKSHVNNCANANWADTFLLTDAWPRLTHASQQWFSATSNTNAFAQTIRPICNPYSITLPTRLIKSNILALEEKNDAYGQTLMSETMYFARENERRKAKQGVTAQSEVFNSRQLNHRGVVQKAELPKRHAILS